MVPHFGEENGSGNLWRIAWPQAHFRKCKVYLDTLEMEKYKDMQHLFCSTSGTHYLHIPWNTGFLANPSFQHFILRLSLFQRKICIICGKACSLRGKKRIILSFDKYFPASLAKPEWHLLTKSMSPSLFGGLDFGVLFLWVFLVGFFFVLGFVDLGFFFLNKFQLISKHIVGHILKGIHWNKATVNTKQRL